MNFRCFTTLNNLLYIFLLLPKISFGQGCNFNGVNCISCTDYQYCSGGFPEERVISCKSGDSCADDQLKLCQKKLNCYALNECTQAGIFSDVMVDSNYYVCLNDANSGFLKYEFTCPEGNFFDKSSLTCVSREATLAISEDPTSVSVTTDPSSSSSSTDLTSPSTPTTGPTSPSSPTTESTLPSTPTTGPTSPSSPTTESTLPSTPTTGPTSPSSPTTESTSPSIPTSGPTSPSSLSTELTSPTSPTTKSTPPSTPSTEPTTPSSPTKSTLPSPTPTPPFTCVAPGIFPNPENCKMYYRCSTSLRAFFYICPGSSYFNENILKCSMIITPACQEQILKNSTSTLLPTTSTTTTPKPTPTPSTPTTSTTTTSTLPTTTTTTSTTTTTATTTTMPTTKTSTTTQPPATTATTPTSTTPFSCTVTGIFANPLDCKTYYRCNLSGQIFQYVCPGNTYFNEFTKRCSLIITPRCRKLIQG